MELEDCDNDDVEHETTGVLGKTGDKEDKLNPVFAKDGESLECLLVFSLKNIQDRP